MIKYQIKEWLSKPWVTATLSGIIVASITLGIAIPVLGGNNGDGLGNINAYSRDALSGTREAFEKGIGFDEDTERYSKNVVEVDGSSTMENNIELDVNGIGYTSATQLMN